MNNESFGYRRIVRRIPCFLSGSYKTADGSDREIKCQDISHKGTKVITRYPLAVNSQLKMDIQTKKINSLALEGKICWNKKAVGGWVSGVVFNRILPFELDKVI